ncbi:MAG TPA: hypothetical protein VGX72_11000 [Solirubrobacteraceae bacterium]|nr:hypothetical protein [Solirubrobacteraceae bacterium]
MSHRPLVFVSGLTVADYMLWNWSLNSNHDVLALVSGLTLPPLAVGWVWLLALTLASVAARYARRPAARMRIRRIRRVKATATRHQQRRQRSDGATAATSIALEEGAAVSAAAGAPSRKLAA